MRFVRSALFTALVALAFLLTGGTAFAQGAARTDLRFASGALAGSVALTEEGGLVRL